MDKIIFPYGEADFYLLVMENNFYVDRTAYIRLLEEKGRTLLFLRPRRFGKSLLLSMLENYYDVKKAAEFERLFGHLAIGQDPTPRHNRYLIMRWNFSEVLPHGTSEHIKQSLYTHLNKSIYKFVLRYEDLLRHKIEIDYNDAMGTFQAALAVVQTTPYPLYLFIDEYDNFANEVLTAKETGGYKRYLDLVEGEGILKTIFKMIKAELGGQGLERVFMTGVSPIVVNDMTSGFNVVENITFAPDLHEICGFREDEVVEVLERVGAIGALSPQQVQEALTMMRTFYNGYRFGQNQPTLLYNPTLVLYFLKHLQSYGSYPQNMLDSNLAMDGQKIAYIAHLPDGEQIVATALNEDRPLAIVQMAERFGVNDIFYGNKSSQYMISLLYYFGVLTLANQSTPMGELVFAIPNLVSRQLYLEQIRDAFLTTGKAEDRAYQVAKSFYLSGDIETVCTFIEQTYFTVFDNRDYRWTNELTIKTIFLTLLYNSARYVMDSEPALQREYGDLVMLLRPDMRQLAMLEFLLEFKYLSLPDVGLSGKDVRERSRAELATLKPVAAQQAEARKKLAGYRQVLANIHGDLPRLRCYSVVAIGYERLVWAEVE